MNENHTYLIDYNIVPPQGEITDDAAVSSATRCYDEAGYTHVSGALIKASRTSDESGSAVPIGKNHGSANNVGSLEIKTGGYSFNKVGGKNEVMFSEKYLNENQRLSPPSVTNNNHILVQNGDPPASKRK